MEIFWKKGSVYLLIIFTIVMYNSCKTDEFRFDDITLNEDFRVKIITPIFSGKDKDGHVLEFRDFIHNWNNPFTNTAAPYTVLQYSDGTYKTIPTSLIFDPSVVIDSLQFLIQGPYIVTEIELVFIVTNSCPFPLNLQLQFLNRNSLNNLGPPILPPAFLEADFNQTPVKPVTTVHTMKLDSLQMQSFTDSKRIKLTSWYDQTNFINQNDTISAHYPVNVSIALIGTVQIKP